MTDDRSERLRKRRKRSTESVGSAQESADEPPVDQSEREESEERVGDSVSIKDEQVGTYMYLPEFQTKEMRRLYNVLKAEYEFEYDEEFEKNRHFYPLIVQYGLDDLDDVDTSEIRTRLEQLYD